jgi:hypothetical protein
MFRNLRSSAAKNISLLRVKPLRSVKYLNIQAPYDKKELHLATAMLVNIYQSTRCLIPEEINLNEDSNENIRYHIVIGNFKVIINILADPSDRAVYVVCLRPLASWGCGFKSHQGHECLSLLCVVYCHGGISASG